MHCLVSGHFCGHVSFILLGKTRGKPELLSYYFAIPDKKSELLKIMLLRTDKKPLGRKKPKSRTSTLGRSHVEIENVSMIVQCSCPSMNVPWAHPFSSLQLHNCYLIFEDYSFIFHLLYFKKPPILE